MGEQLSLLIQLVTGDVEFGRPPVHGGGSLLAGHVTQTAAAPAPEHTDRQTDTVSPPSVTARARNSDCRDPGP